MLKNAFTLKEIFGIKELFLKPFVAFNTLRNHSVLFTQRGVLKLLRRMTSKAILTTSSHLNGVHFLFCMTAFALKHTFVSFIIVVIKLKMTTCTIPTTSQNQRNKKTQKKYNSHSLPFVFVFITKPTKYANLFC